jgi:hypothetical protein
VSKTRPINLPTAVSKLLRFARGLLKQGPRKPDPLEHPTPVRTAFREYLESQRQFMKAADTCSHRGWPDRGAVLHNTWQCQRLYIRRQELRFEYLLRGGGFEIGVWNSLTKICCRLDENWSDIDERGALDNDSAYKDLAIAIAETEQTRASMDKNLLDGPMRTMQQHAEYRAARQAIYEKVHELDKRLEGRSE